MNSVLDALEAALEAIAERQSKGVRFSADSKFVRNHLRALIEVARAAEFASGYFKAHGDEYQEATWLIELRASLVTLLAEEGEAE